MSNFSKALFFICIFYSITSLAQKEVYVDENMQEIDSKTYFKKCKSSVLGCLEYKTKSLIVNKIYKHHDFGKISKTEYEQIRLLLNKNYNGDLIKIQSIVLHFRDSLFGYNELHLKRLLSSKNTTFNDLSAKAQRKLLIKAKSIADGRISSHFEHVKSSNLKCKEFLEKNGSVDFYVFNEDINYIKKFGEKKNWIKNDSLLDKLFFSKHPHASYLIIKPNGDFFVSDRYISKVNYLKLLKEGNWSKFKQDLEKSIKFNSISGQGFFDQKDSYAKNECIIEY